MNDNTSKEGICDLALEIIFLHIYQRSSMNTFFFFTFGKNTPVRLVIILD